ncbi:MAG: zinc transporter ZntB [Gammaproteobacteria bacterium]|nr:zinc transporter ZntB [Gammaproteobacteria bacterium]
MQEQNIKDNFYIFGYALDGKGGGQSIPSGDPGAPGAQHWYHIDYSFSNAEQWLHDTGLEKRIIEAMVRSDTRPRALVTERGALIMLRGINRNPGAEPDDMVSLRIWIEKDRVITVRQRRLMAVQAVREELVLGAGPHGTQEVVTRVVELLADRIAEFVDELEDRVDEFEGAVQGSTNLESRAEVSALRRQVASVRRYLAPQRDALEALYRNSAGMLDSRHAFEIREMSDRITRYVEDLDLVRERILVVQEEMSNAIAQQQNARTYVL